MNRILFAVLTMLFVTSMYAQPIQTSSYEQMIETADSAYNSNDYINAIEWYGKAYKESKDKNLAALMADLYFQMGDYKKAEKRYDRLVNKDKTGEFQDDRYRLARTKVYLGKYAEALTEFRTLLTTTENEELKVSSQIFIDGIENMDKLNDNIDAVVGPIGGEINSALSEYSPRQYADGSLYYGALVGKRPIEIENEDDAEEATAMIYVSKRNSEGEYEEPVALGEQINRPGYHSGSLTFSEDGRRMYFTRATLNGNELGDYARIYVANKNDAGWGAADEVPSIQGDYYTTQPAIGELYGNEVLFFVSDMPGGFGGMDIYYTTVLGDGFSSPVNLGPSINTSEDDITPFYKDGTLYFASKGYPGLGGFDIYYATWDGGSWSTVTNMGFNYNSSYDDQYLSLTGDGSKGFLTTYRPHKDKKSIKGSRACCPDIYNIALRDIIVDLLAHIEDEEGPLKGGTVELIDMSTGDDPMSKSNFTSNDFNFLLESDHEYKVRFTKEGYYPDSVSFNTVGILDDYTVKKTMVLKKMPPPPPEPEEPTTQVLTKNESIRLNNIYYDFDKSNILPDAEKDLLYLKEIMDQYPSLVIELSSHTDAQGKDNYNKRLSQRRANSAARWLIRQGVDKDRIKPVGYGEKFILNQCTNGVSCTDDEHRFNRRTEFKILDGPETIIIKSPVSNWNPDTGGGESFGKYEPFFGFIFDSLPEISLHQDSLHIGTIKHGEKKEVSFEFTNTGNADLVIELVTACKCTDIDWPRKPVAPGAKGVIKAVFDSTTQDKGELVKTLDIISNTDPMLIEAKFSVVIE